MTANQIAYASEQEQERHNLATEDYNNRLLDLNKQIANETERHNQITESITKDYNDRYLAWQEAQGSQKLAIEEELKNIQEQKTLQDREYQNSMVILQDRKNDIEQQRANDTRWFNEQTAWLQAEANRLNKYRWDNEFSLKNQELVFKMGAEFEQRRYEFEEQLGTALRGNLLSMYNLQQRQKEWNDQALLRGAQVFSTIAGGVGSIFGAGSSGLRAIPWALKF